jgi:hypothetical protein
VVSKVDAQRAMREARYAEAQARRAATDSQSAPSTRAAPRADRPGLTGGPGAAAAPKAAATDPAKAPDRSPPADQGAAAELCGHRSIGNKSCRRPAGHAEKNHRYK